MNRNRKTISRPRRAALCVATVVLCSPWMHANAFGQGDFGTSDYPPEYQAISQVTARQPSSMDQKLAWQPPAVHRQPDQPSRLMQPPVVPARRDWQQPSVHVADRANGNVSTASWPQQAVGFDNLVQPATLETSTSASGPSVIDRLGNTVGSAGEMLGSLKSGISETASGWFEPNADGGGWAEKIKTTASSPGTRKMIGSLALVVGLYFAFVVVMRKLSPAGSRNLPPEVVEVMGQLPFGPRQHLQLIRLGSKLLLLMNGPEGTHPIGEITDPQEVQLLSDTCRRTGGLQSSSNSNVASAVRRLADLPRQQGSGREVTSENLSDVLRRLERAANVSSQSSFEA